VRNDVTKNLGVISGILGAGEDVYRNEAVKTGAESSTKLIFLDSTNLAVGPFSRLVLDRFVFDPDRSSQTMAVNLAKGVFRFTTGVLDKQAYSITTPTASIGVRGTILDIAVDRDSTRVTLVEGSAIVCPRGKTPKSGDCVTLDQVGQTAEVTRAGASLTSHAVDFGTLCLADLGLCGGYASYSTLGTLHQLGLTNADLGVTGLNLTDVNDPLLYVNGAVVGETSGTGNGQGWGPGGNSPFGDFGPAPPSELIAPSALFAPPPAITTPSPPGIPPPRPPIVPPPPPITAVPEPSTWAMMLLGLIGLGYAGRRRTKNAPRVWPASGR
jgi:hypothetical protein